MQKPQYMIRNTDQPELYIHEHPIQQGTFIVGEGSAKACMFDEYEAKKALVQHLDEGWELVLMTKTKLAKLRQAKCAVSDK